MTINTDMPPLTVGILGFSMYFILTLVVAFRKGSGGILTLRKTFHLSLFIYVALEAISYIPMTFFTHDSYTPPYYACHLLAVSFDVTAFSLVTVLWSRTVLNVTNKKYRWIYCLVGTVDVGFAIATCSVIGDMAAHAKGGNLSDWAASSPSYELLLLLEPITLTFNALCVIVYGSRMLHKLVSLRNWDSLPRTVQVRILTQTFFTMFSCAFCYLLRSTLLFLEYRRIQSDESLMPTNWMWWFGAIWIPQIVPSGLLLFTMRNLDKKRERERRNLGGGVGGGVGGRGDGAIRGERGRRLDSLPQDEETGAGLGIWGSGGKGRGEGGGELEKSLMGNEYGKGEGEEESWGDGDQSSVRSNSVTF
ncbi:hypothetical protein TrCOL_g6615 [Triparma columacea]|uniref:Uncharacterized protein n=1 Tax=Triparma columacea TaxID=722753 RepID=A0A9W7GL78_9STRA|nr:hypothetical protein TrCOL_g6615 [Triparma columacea]